ncbi:phage tail protein, partial [Photorhabdus aballayi]|uniref:phage tail protein n=1 Tax=Photorhabdus aballayi TaxID=2991723 RepID=UPI0035D5A8A3
MATRQTWDGPEQYQPWIIQYSTKNKPSAKDIGMFPGVVSVDSIPTRSFIGPFSGERTAGWAKGINIGQSGDVGQIYITPEGELYTYFFNSNGAVEGGIVNTHPIGAPIPWPLPNAPIGYFSCNGQSFNKSIYPKLAVAYQSGTLPDLRGEFIRGWDDRRGVDPGRVCGSWQADSTKRIQLAEGYSSSNGNISIYQGKMDGYRYPLGRDAIGGATATSIANNTSGHETRPRNVAFN